MSALKKWKKRDELSIGEKQGLYRGRKFDCLKEEIAEQKVGDVAREEKDRSRTRND